MNIFISYSVTDTASVAKIADHLRSHGNVRYWAEDKEPGKDAWNTIFGWIDAADLVFVVISGATLRRAMSVGQEVGRAQSKNRLIVPLVEKGIPASELGCLHGLTYIPLDPANPDGALEEARKAVERRKIEKDNEAKALLAIGAIVALICIASD
jgi:hypothetical protein